jgi:hypothetical protein
MRENAYMVDRGGRDGETAGEGGKIQTGDARSGISWNAFRKKSILDSLDISGPMGL